MERNLAQMVIAAKRCLDQDMPMPAMVLIYSLIDALAWAANPKEKNTRTRFENWLTTYVYSATPLHCTPTELYAARCGVLHTLTSKADLHVRGKLREIAYAWGPAKVDTLSEASALAKISHKFVGLHLNDFLHAVTQGIRNTFAAAEGDRKLAANLEKVAPLHFGDMPRATLEGLLGQAKGAE